MATSPLAGAWLAVAVWLKYNAIVYALPIGMAAAVWPPPRSARARHRRSAGRTSRRDRRAAFGLVSLIALAILRRCTARSAICSARRSATTCSTRAETYGGPAHAVRYLAGLPLERATSMCSGSLGGLGAPARLLARFAGRAAQVDARLARRRRCCRSRSTDPAGLAAVLHPGGAGRWRSLRAGGLASALGRGTAWKIALILVMLRPGLARRRRAGPCLAASPVRRARS